MQTSWQREQEREIVEAEMQVSFSKKEAEKCNKKEHLSSVAERWGHGEASVPKVY